MKFVMTTSIHVVFASFYNHFNLNLPRLKFEIKIQNNLTKSSKNKLTSINSHELYTLRLGSATINEGLISVGI
jgi:hypothetical protein